MFIKRQPEASLRARLLSSTGGSGKSLKEFARRVHGFRCLARVIGNGGKAPAKREDTKMKKNLIVGAALAVTLAFASAAPVLATEFRGQGNGCAQTGTCQGNGAGYVDADGDGACDNAGSGVCQGNGNANGNGAGYVDADGDGACDNAGSGVCQGNGNGSGVGNGAGKGACQGRGCQR